MAQYKVNWQERYACSAVVEADSADEARTLVLIDPSAYHPDHGDFIGVDSDYMDAEPFDPEPVVPCPQCNGAVNLCNGYCTDTGLVSASSAKEWHSQNDLDDYAGHVARGFPV